MGRFFAKFSIPQIITLLFVSGIFIGGVLLSLPIASKTGEATPFLDALFTATSAICVTGQVTLNTAEHWSLFGQLVILALIELGGLGFMAILTLIFLALGQRFNIKQQKVIQESLNLSSIAESQTMIVYLLKFSFIVQGLGALLLSFVLVPEYGWGKGIYYSIFHAISAYCNAGFDLFGDSLLSYQDEPLVLFTIAGLIFTGGLGFVVWRNVLSYPKTRQLLVHTKIVLASTGLILALSFLGFWIFESSQGTFDHLSGFDKFANVLFMAVTPRTAGYANVDYASVSLASLVLTLLLMFIGGASGSTAGGIKVNTLAVVVLYIVRDFQGRETHIFNRRISDGDIRKALYIFVAGIFMVSTASLILAFTETLPQGAGMEYILMEVFSCFGTVGLTMGLTPMLTSVGKLVLIVLMLAGRVGLLTFFWSFGDHSKKQKISYPEASMMIG